MATDRALDQAAFDRLRDQKVFIDLVGYNQGPEVPFIRQKIRERIENAKGTVVLDKVGANTVFEGNLQLTGTDVDNKRVPVISRTERIPATVRMVVSHYELPEGRKIYEKTVEGHAKYSETKVFGIGPFRSYK